MTRTFRAALVACTALVFAAPALLPARDEATTSDGFTSLFNGKDLTGWKIHPNPNPGALSKVMPVEKDGKVVGYVGELKKKPGEMVKLWTVTPEGTLVGSGPSTHLFSDKGDYTDVDFRVEAKINDKGNSGMYIRAKFAPGFPPGYECQINATGGDPIKTGSLYPDYRTKLGDYRKDILVMNKAAHKPDEYFTEEVKAVGSHIQISVNGEQTVDFTDPNNSFTQGHLALQGHDPGTVVTFKKIEVKDLAKK